MTRRYYSTREFAVLTGEKEDTIRRRCARGAYRCRRTGERWRIWAGELYESNTAATPRATTNRKGQT